MIAVKTWASGVLACAAMCMFGTAHAQDQYGCAAADPDVRIAACSALIEAGPGATSDFSMVFNNRGIGYAAKGELDQAILDYNQAIYLNGRFAFAFSNRGVVYEAKGDLARAIEDYSKAIALAPDLRAAFNNRCYALAQLGQTEKALADCNKSLTLQSGDARTLDSRGYVYFLAGRYREAIDDLNDAIRLSPSMPTAFYVRGMAKILMGDATGQEDLAHAQSLDKTIAGKMAKLGILPQRAASAAP